MEELGYVIKFDKVYLFKTANMFTPRIDRARIYKTEKGASNWIEESETKNGILEAGISKSDLKIKKVIVLEDSENGFKVRLIE